MKKIIYYFGLLILLSFLSFGILSIKPPKAHGALEIKAKTLLGMVEEKPVVKPAVKPVEVIEAPVAVVYTVIENDTLIRVGEIHNVEWQRLWAKNTQLTSPDTLTVGEQITIPFPDEVLSRDVPIVPTVYTAPTITPNVTVWDYSGGNTYSYGYCTWYIKNRRPDLPNSLGNANSWFWRASSMGMAVGYEPRPGAVGTTSAGAWGHVVLVESVNGDGTINISEMNAPIWGVVTYRTANAGEFSYIY